MQYLIVLALVAVAHAAPQYFNSFAIPTVLPDGHLADTPEVAAAKVAHFSEHAKALSGGHFRVAAAPVVSHYAAPAAIATPVVSHYAYPRYYNPFVGPFAVPTVLPDGHLADTPEVAIAKVSHFAEHAKALSHSAF